MRQLVHTMFTTNNHTSFLVMKRKIRETSKSLKIMTRILAVFMRKLPQNHFLKKKSSILLLCSTSKDKIPSALSTSMFSESHQGLSNTRWNKAKLHTIFPLILSSGAHSEPSLKSTMVIF